MSDTRTDNDLVVGVDLGGTNLRAAVYERLGAARDGRPALGEPPETPAPAPVRRHGELVGEPRDPERVVDRVAQVIRDLCPPDSVGAGGAGDAGERSPIRVGIGFAGMLRGGAGHVANSPHLRWRDVPFGRLVRERLGPGYAVTVENDVNAITYGEYALGAGAGVRDVLAVFIGTGIGAGIIAGGQLITGASGCAGELGHIVVAYDDRAPLCACGRRGCIEAFAGGSSIQARARAELASRPGSAVVKLAGTADAVHPGHIDEAAAEGDAWALDLYAEIAPLLAVALASAITLLNPARLILGGGLLSRAPVLRAHVITALELAVADPPMASLVITDAALGDDAGLIGSALLALDRL